MKEEQYLGIHVSPLSYDEILQSIKERIRKNQKSTIIAVNPEKIIKAQTDGQLRDLINSSTYKIPDGVGVLLASKLKGGSIRSRVTGVDMMDRLVQMASKEEFKVFLYGAKEDVVLEAKLRLEQKYPELKIAGYRNGYEKDEQAVVSSINESGADILFVAMGSPKQELWIRRHMNELNVKVFQGVGGSFDVFAGNVKRAPALFRRLGLEWLYRLVKEPKRFKRQLALPKFLLKILLER